MKMMIASNLNNLTINLFFLEYRAYIFIYVNNKHLFNFLQITGAEQQIGFRRVKRGYRPIIFPKENRGYMSLGEKRGYLPMVEKRNYLPMGEKRSYLKEMAEKRGYLGEERSYLPLGEKRGGYMPMEEKKSYGMGEKRGYLPLSVENLVPPESLMNNPGHPTDPDFKHQWYLVRL